MPLLTIRVQASDPKDAAEKAYHQIAYALAGSNGDDRTLYPEIRKVRERYTPTQIQEKDMGQWDVILYANMTDALDYKRAKNTT